MMSFVILLIIFAYVSVLFIIARMANDQHSPLKNLYRSPHVYALSIGVYCTSWTFYGLVGSATVSVWDFVPILLGPILLFTVGYPLLRKIFALCKQEHIHSIADFMSSRYGKRQGIAALTTIIVMLATVPYMSLQLKAVSDTLPLLIDKSWIGNQDVTLVVAMSMVAFALIFGASQIKVDRYNAGLVSTIAFESVVKLLAMIMVAALGVYWVWGDSQSLPVLRAAQPQSEGGLEPDFWVEVLIAGGVVLCLPRMFHMIFVECRSEAHLRTIRTLSTSYLILIGLCVYAIAAAGQVLFEGSDVAADTYVLAIPLSEQMTGISIFAFLGGFSAATAMIIVASVTLSQMLSNDVILPLLLRNSGRPVQDRDYSTILLLVRRTTIVSVILFAYLYQAVFAENEALTNIGLVAFALAIQLAPALILGMYWSRANAWGTYAGLLSGLLVWGFTMMLPLLTKVGLLSPDTMTQGLMGHAWLRPDALFGLSMDSAYASAVLWSVSINTLMHILVSSLTHSHGVDLRRALAFVRPEQLDGMTRSHSTKVSVREVYQLLKQFVGSTVADKLVHDYFKLHEPDQSFSKGRKATPALIDQAEKALSGIVGVASAKSMISKLETGRGFDADEVVNLFEETSRALSFNQDILFSSFDNISSGISVVNRELKIVAWNKRYELMFNYPEGKLQIGIPVAELVKFNAERGLLGPGDPDELVEKRIDHLLKGKAYRVVRQQQDSQVIEIKGSPLPDGGYVTAYDDITGFVEAQKALERSNVDLEQRVEARTAEVTEMNDVLKQEVELRKNIESQLRVAKSSAELANANKSQFLAHAGHDILQPINAAQLYANALIDEADNEDVAAVASRIRDAVISAEQIISSLMEIARLDTGQIKTDITSFKLDDLLQSVFSEARAVLPDGLEVRYVTSSLVVRSDRNFLKRIIQNLLNNAIKYTPKGKVLVGCRRRNKVAEICILDSGEGIASHHQEKIFEEFFRVNKQGPAEGLGLGLAVVGRLARLLEHPIKVQSALRKGSLFSVSVPLGSSSALEISETVQSESVPFGALKALYVDDERANLDATDRLLRSWGVTLSMHENAKEALDSLSTDSAYDLLILDYQLGDDQYNGITLGNALKSRLGPEVPVCIVSASNDPDLRHNARGQGFHYLPKPVKPGKLRALLSQISRASH